MSELQPHDLGAAPNSADQSKNQSDEGAVRAVPHASEATPDDARPPLYVSGWGVMGQSVPDVATGSTPLTRKDDI